MKGHSMHFFCALAISVALCGCENPQPPEQDGVTIVAFCATWCAPCKTAKYVLRTQAIDLNVVILDYDTNKARAKAYGVKSLPAFFIFVDGRQTGATNNVYAALRLARGG